MRACAPVEMMIVCAAYSVAADPDPLRVRGEVDAIGVGGHELGAEAHGLLAELRHELGTEDSVDETGVVLDVGGEHELTAGADPLDHERVQVGAGGVDRRGESGGPGSDDDDFPRVHGSSSAPGRRRRVHVGQGLLGRGLRLIQQNHPTTRKIPPSPVHAAQTWPSDRDRQQAERRDRRAA